MKKRDNTSAAPRRPSARVLLAFRIFVAGLWILILLGAVETHARWRVWWISHHNPLVLAEREMLEFWDTVDEGVWERRHWSYRPNAEFSTDSPQGTYHVKINRFGFRAPDIEVPKPEGVFRIVCVGGSTTLEGMTNETTYPAFLEVELSPWFDDVRIEVVNAGISGLTSEGEAGKVLEYLRMDPDMILHYNVVNDIVRLHYPRWRKESPASIRLLSRSKFLEGRINETLNPLETFEEYMREVTFANRQRLVEQARANGVEVVAASFVAPDSARLDKVEREFLTRNAQTMFTLQHMTIRTYSAIVDRYNRMLEIFCEREGIDYLKVAENFPQVTHAFDDICHMNTDGIRLKARIIAEQLRPLIEERLGVGTPTTPVGHDLVGTFSRR